MKNQAARQGKRIAVVPTTWGIHGYDVFLDDGSFNPTLYTTISPISPMWANTHLGWIGENPTRCTCPTPTEQPDPNQMDPTTQPHGGSK